jgi:hypothetical protein
VPLGCVKPACWNGGAPERVQEWNWKRSSFVAVADKQKSEGQPGEHERGKPASFDPVTGEVHGSGSGAGGGGNPDEDYDSDPMAGSGAEPQGGPRPRSEAVDRPTDPDEGV